MDFERSECLHFERCYSELDSGNIFHFFVVMDIKLIFPFEKRSAQGEQSQSSEGLPHHRAIEVRLGIASFPYKKEFALPSLVIFSSTAAGELIFVGESSKNTVPCPKILLECDCSSFSEYVFFAAAEITVLVELRNPMREASAKYSFPTDVCEVLFDFKECAFSIESGVPFSEHNSHGKFS